MMNAKQARECAAAYKKTVIDNEIKKVKAAIQEAAQKGKETCCIDGSIATETKMILANLGYKVSHNDVRNESITYIDWREQ